MSNWISEEKKFYHCDWKLTELLEARNDGLITDEGEAWRYSYTGKDGKRGKYDMLYRRVGVDAEAAIPDRITDTGETV